MSIRFRKSPWASKLLRPIASGLTSAAAETVRRHPRAYRTCNALLGFLGYAYLSAFPMLTVLALGALALRLATAPFADGWPLNAALLASATLGGWITYALVRRRPAHSTGHSVGRGEADELWQLVDSICRHYGTRLMPRGPVIHDICITPQAGLDLTVTPRWGLPYTYTRTLLIGLPLLQTVAPHHFEALLARKIGQCSGRGDPLGAWLYRLRHLWSFYEQPQPSRATPCGLAMTAFFAWYAPLFRWFSTAAAREYEFRGDRYALEFSSYEDAVEALCAQAVSTRFLEDKFWPAFERLSRAVPRPTRLPYVSMERAFVKGVKQAEADAWLRKAWVLKSASDGPIPPLRERLEQMCDGRPHGYIKPAETAATLCLRPAALAIVISRLDREWLTANLASWQRRYARRKRADQQLAGLRRRRNGVMTNRDIKRYLALVKANYDGRSAAALYRDLIAAHPDNAKVLFIAGQRLVGLGDPSGVHALEKAMAADERCAKNACKLISSFNARQQRAA